MTRNTEWIDNDEWFTRASDAEDRSYDAILDSLQAVGASTNQAVRSASAIMAGIRAVAGWGRAPGVRSPIEALFWLAVEGPAFARSVSVHYEPPGYEPYLPDFELRRDAERLIVELDGHEFHEKTREQAEHDKRRDRWFAAQGHRVIRFTGREVWRDVHACVTEALAFFPATDQPTES